MKDGFIKIACAVPDVKVADCGYNADEIISLTREAYDRGVRIVCFPELSVTGYTCGDLFMQSALIDSAEENLLRIASETADMDIISIAGFPFAFMNKLYNCAAVLHKGKILGIVPKTCLPDYGTQHESRYFTSGPETVYNVLINGENTGFGTKQIFELEGSPEFSFAVEICEDLWSLNPPSAKHTANGASMIFNLSASSETVGKDESRRAMLIAESEKLICGYAYANAGIGESTTDLVFSGHCLIAENGNIISENLPFGRNRLTVADIDVQKLVSERRKNNTFITDDSDYSIEYFKMTLNDTELERSFSQTPFIPSDKEELSRRCRDILNMQAVGLMTRLRHIGCKKVVLGLSGGLDSTLALIVTVHAFDMLELDRKDIHTITMPCFGTTDRTYKNACELAKAYGASLEEINIRASVNQHFVDIGHNPGNHDVTYENSQARERTQILMDKSNQYGGIVIGTGDLSELALGWATYNGDHMSMYGVNGSIPKTLVRWLVRYEAENCDGKLKEVLFDVLDTPVSPELLPPEKDGTIAQKTEDLVGPYELHDFFIFYAVRYGYSPAKIFRIARLAFWEKYSPDVIMKWLKKFYWRFFSQQFKRSCLPDGPKIGSVGLSPRGEWQMPSDACVSLWIKQLEEIEKTL